MIGRVRNERASIEARDSRPYGRVHKPHNASGFGRMSFIERGKIIVALAWQGRKMWTFSGRENVSLYAATFFRNHRRTSKLNGIFKMSLCPFHPKKNLLYCVQTLFMHIRCNISICRNAKRVFQRKWRQNYLWSFTPLIASLRPECWMLKSEIWVLISKRGP